MSDPRQKQVQRFGPERWEVRGGHDWSLWDLWFCVITVRDHDGNLDGLAPLLVEAIRKPTFGNSGPSEAKLSHLDDLQARLDAAGMSPADLADAEMLADKAISKRAREKVTGRVSLEHRACTAAMLDTPRRRLEHRARYGHWSTFPSDPAPFFEHRDSILDHHADEALEALADLYVATQSRDRFVMAARRLGSRAWRPIEAMARSHLKVKDETGAIAVFRAADQPGFHRDHIRKLCLSLTGFDLADGSKPTEGSR